ncbi:MAG: hypothetical protein U0939_22575 [Pirellulales bacterium]
MGSSRCVRWDGGCVRLLKLGCYDEVVFEGNDRLDFILETGQGMLKAWY